MPSAVPTSSPMRAFVPDTVAAAQIWSRLSVNASQILDGLGRKYGFQSKTSTACSHSTRKATPNTTGGHTARTTRRTRRSPVLDPRGGDVEVVDLVAAQRLAHLGDLLEEPGVLAGVDVAVVAELDVDRRA